MSFVQSKGFRIALLVIALCLIGLNIWNGRRGSGVYATQRGVIHDDLPRPLPSSGFAWNETNGQIPGNPTKTEDQMRQLYKMEQIFLKRNGHYPCNAGKPDISEDMWLHWKDYGFRQPQDTWRLISSEDFRYSDIGVHQKDPEAFVPWISNCIRPDGTAIGSPKKNGTRDVLLYTDMYYHHNIRLFSNGVTTAHPAGFYLVLWDDGEVSRVPYDQMRFAPKAKNAFYFPGQAGEPEGGTQSYAERQHWLNTGPH